MKKFILLFGLALTTPLASWADVGFEGGNEFTPANLSGLLQVRCHNDFGLGYSYAWAQCSTQVLDPREMAHFVGPENHNATSVTLTAFHEDGSNRTKNQTYKGGQGKSKKRFNLWIATLTQAPLLEVGNNRIVYSLLDKNDNTLASGEFMAVVRTPATSRQCRTGFLNSSFPNDCRFPQNLCGRYFQLENYCE